MADTIQVLDKKFKRYITADQIQKTVCEVADQITRDYQGREVTLCPVLTGSYLFAADLSRAIGFDTEMDFVRYSSYSGTQSTGRVTTNLGFSKHCRGRHVIIVEDIVDTGISMDYMLGELRRLEPASIAVCTFFFKPASFQKDFRIDYVGMEIPNNFILGYGLDYNGKGRTYKDIYILDN